MKKLAYGAVGLSAVLLSSCAHHLSKQACEATNWQQMGFEDASSGRVQRDFRPYIKDCAKYHISLNNNLYVKGWNSGAVQYCHPSESVGIQAGQAGKSYYAVSSMRNEFCQMANQPVTLDNFKKGYDQGIKQFCTYQKGYAIAMNAQNAPDVCPKALKGRFLKGWQTGVAKLCGNTANAFALGRDGKPYPGVCSGPGYISFKSEYNRGHAIHSRIVNLQNQVNDINQHISDLVFQYRLDQISDTEYQLGSDGSVKARQALKQVNELLHQRSRIQNQLFNAKTKR